MIPRNRYVSIEYLKRDIDISLAKIIDMREALTKEAQRLGTYRVMLAMLEMDEAPVTALKYGINDINNCDCAAEFDGIGYELL